MSLIADSREQIAPASSAKPMSLSRFVESIARTLLRIIARLVHSCAGKQPEKHAGWQAECDIADAAPKRDAGRLTKDVALNEMRIQRRRFHHRALSIKRGMAPPARRPIRRGWVAVCRPAVMKDKGRVLRATSDGIIAALNR